MEHEITLSFNGVALSKTDMKAIELRRVETLKRLGRFEFEPRSVNLAADHLADSPFLMKTSCADTVSDMVELFLELRGQVPVDIGDDELMATLRNRFDAVEGECDAIDVAELAGALPLSIYSPAELGEYRIVDDDGREYVFSPPEWEYDEQAPGWDGEEWADDFEH